MQPSTCRPFDNRLPIAVAALILILPYFPTLTSPFDFVDDGCLVYRSPGTWWGQVWQKTVREFHERGPFRPVSWAHWEAAASLLGDNAPAHRLLHLFWAFLSAVLLLCFFAELSIPSGAAFLAGAVAMWMPYRNEIWYTLGATEAFAMPYALLALIAALRGSRSARPGAWDLTAWGAAVLAVGCKNTFAAIVPAQVFLRIVGGGLPWREALRRHGFAGSWLAVVLVFPVVHFVAYKLDPQPKEYQTQMFGPEHVMDWGWMLLRSEGIKYLGVGLVLLVVTVWRSRLATPGVLSWRTLLGAAVLLAVFGVGIYLPINGIEGRYTIPAVWGLDLVLAGLFAALAASRPGFWKRACLGTLAAGLMVAVASNLNGQGKFSARAELLWQVARHLEDPSYRSARVVWWAENRPHGWQLAMPEGVHLSWHLESRRRTLAVIVLDRPNPLPQDRETLLVSGDAAPPGVSWELVREYVAPYRLGTSAHRCYLWASK